MPDIYPPQYNTDVGRVRKYIPDTKLITDPEDPYAEPTYIFSDEELQSFIDDQTEIGLLPTRAWHIRRAAADAMIAMANNENLILKKIVSEDLETDGPAVATALIKAATLLYGRADAEEFNDVNMEVFISVPYVHDPPRYDWR